MWLKAQSKSQCRQFVLFLIAVSGVLAKCRDASAAATEPISPVPREQKIDPRRAALGEKLFRDARLSRGYTRSCETCHPLDSSGMDRLPVAGLHLRNTLTIFNVSLNSTFNWDGVTDSLEEHADRVLTNPALMGITWPELLKRLARDASYVMQFKSAFGQAISRSVVLNAIAGYERSLVTPDSRFDRYLRGDGEALTVREKEGYRLFKLYGCVSCHQGVNIGGNLFQKFGVFEDMISAETSPLDLGRFRLTREPRDWAVFRVPPLRNVAVTGPYFHDGQEPTLRGAVETMAKVQLGFRLRHDEISRIVEYLKTLTGEYRGAALKVRSEGGE
jgi:cytochrome c peroxidase